MKPILLQLKEVKPFKKRYQGRIAISTDKNDYLVPQDNHTFLYRIQKGKIAYEIPRKTLSDALRAPNFSIPTLTITYSHPSLIQAFKRLYNQVLNDILPDDLPKLPLLSSKQRPYGPHRTTHNHHMNHDKRKVDLYIIHPFALPSQKPLKAISLNDEFFLQPYTLFDNDNNQTLLKYRLRIKGKSFQEGITLTKQDLKLLRHPDKRYSTHIANINYINPESLDILKTLLDENYTTFIKIEQIKAKRRKLKNKSSS